MSIEANIPKPAGTIFGESSRLELGMELGECPLWDWRTDALYWVDIIRCELFRLTWSEREMTRWPLPSLGGGLALGRDGTLLVATQTGLFRFHPDSGRYEFLLRPEEDIPTNRLNEGKVDPGGNFWIGSISTLGRRQEGALYRIGQDLRPVKVLDGIYVPNSLVFLKDTKFLFADSHLKTISLCELDPETSMVTSRVPFADESGADGMPDGAAPTEKGMIVSAKFGGGRVVLHDQQGLAVEELPMPVTQVTSCAFAGPHLDVLAITTAKRLLSFEERKRQEWAGDVFLVNTSLRGIQEPIATL